MIRFELVLLFLSFQESKSVAGLDEKTPNFLRHNRQLEEPVCFEMDNKYRHIPQGTSRSFGESVAIDSANRRAIIGAPSEEVNGEIKGGAAHILTKDEGGSWVPHSRLQAHPMAYPWQLFGGAVAIDGDVVAVGAPFGVAYQYGTVQIFQYEPFNNTWEWTQTLGDGADSTNFGHSLSLSEDTLAVGADWGINVYVMKTGVFELEQTLSIGGFYWVDVDGDTLVGGSQFDNAHGSNAGVAHIYTRSNAEWTHQKQLYAQDLSDQWGAHFGSSVAVDKDTVAVGATAALNEEGKGKHGVVYVYTRGDDGNWPSEGEKLWPVNDTRVNDNLGTAVSIVGDQILVGAPSHFIYPERPPWDRSGRAYLFQREDGEWLECQTLMGNETEDNFFGVAVALGDDNSAIVGAAYETIDGQYGAGASYFFQGPPFPEPTPEPTEPNLANPVGACTEDELCQTFLGRNGVKMHRTCFGRCRNKCVLVALSNLRSAFGWTCGTCDDE